MNTATATAKNRQPQFVEVLYQRINAYFKDNNISKKGNSMMTGKIIASLICWTGSYAAMFIFKLSYAQFFFIMMFNGFAQVFILLNITHDANHNAISKRLWVNKALSYLMDVNGINSYMWKILHHTGHHNCTNIQLEDEAVIAKGTLRLTPYTPYRKIYKFQHLYFLLLYAVTSIDWIFLKDFGFFFFSKYEHTAKVKHPVKEIIILFAGKLFYVTYMLILPMIFLPFSIGQIFLAFVAMHALIGVYTTFVFQTTHVIESSTFPDSKKEYEHYVYHIFATTADYSVHKPLTNWFSGGLNQHIIHHLVPNICHTHYTELTEIVKETANEYGVPYRENPSMYRALVEHVTLLRRLGRRK